VGIPGAVFVVLVLACLIVVVVLILVKYTRNRTDDWEIEYSELDVGEQLGTGGYGAVHKAVWKGTEVAVKVMAAEKVTKEMEKSFQDEVHTHTHTLLSFMYILNRGTFTGASNDIAEASQRGALHGGVHAAAAHVHRHGVHGPRLPLRCTL
jgi:preprotein translocase subunit YajC